MPAEVAHFHHPPSGTLTYVVSDAQSRIAAVIDPVLGFDVVSGRTDVGPVEDVASYVQAQNLDVEWILETHAHADHLSGAQQVKQRLGGRIGIGEGIRDVQAHFGPVFNLKAPFVADGHQFDHLFADGERFSLGSLNFLVMHTPGHTSDSVTYVTDQHAFVGDTLFMTDSGTARCDFPGGDAAKLYDSIQKIFSLPDQTQIHLCHDYQPGGRDLCHTVLLGEQKNGNIHVGGGTDKATYVAMREGRDATLSLPALIIPAIQVNIQAGRLPESEDNRIAYVRIPLDTL